MAHRGTKTDTAALRRLWRHPTCNPLRLARATGIPDRTLHNACEGVAPLSVPDLRLVVGAMVQLGQEEDALGLVRGLLDLDALGWDLRHAARPASEASLLTAGLHAVGAAGVASSGIAEAAADGRITASEAERLDGPVAHALHQLGRFRAFIRGAPVGQASLPGVAP